MRFHRGLGLVINCMTSLLNQPIRIKIFKQKGNLKLTCPQAFLKVPSATKQMAYPNFIYIYLAFTTLNCLNKTCFNAWPMGAQFEMEIWYIIMKVPSHTFINSGSFPTEDMLLVKLSRSSPNCLTRANLCV